MTEPPPRSRLATSSRIVRDLVALAGGQLASKLFGFLAFAYLARILVPHAYGAVEYAAGLAMIAGMIIDAGLSPIGVRRIARRPESAPRVAAEVLGARVLLAVVLALLLGGVALLTAPDPLTRRLIWLYAASLVALPWAQAWLFQAIDRIGYSALVQTVRMAVFVLGVLLLVRGSDRALLVGVAEILGLAVSGACAAGLQLRFVGPVRLHLDLRDLRALLREGLPVGASNVIWPSTHYAPLLLAVNLLGAAASAHFAAAHRLYIALATLSWIYHFNLFPAIARLAARERDALGALVRASFRSIAWASILAAALLSLLAKPILVTMFGAPFGEAAPALAVLVWALPATLLGDHAAWTLVAHDAERTVTFVQLGGLLLTLAAGVPAVLAWGPPGGAAAMVGSTIAAWAALHLVARRRFAWLPWTPALPPALIAALLLAVAARIAPGPWPAAALVAVGFAALAPLVDRELVSDLRALARGSAAHALSSRRSPADQR